MHELFDDYPFDGLNPDDIRFARSQVQAASCIGEKVLRTAMFFASYDMAKLSCAVGYGEEHSTAALMGHLASHLRWLQMYIERWYPGEAGMPNIQWAYQTKPQEAESGADFALIANFRDYDDSPWFKIVLVQAKRCEHQSISIGHITRKQDGTKTLPWTPDASSLLSKARLQLLGAECKAADVNIESILKSPMPSEHYQLEALVRTHFRGQMISGLDIPWVFYSAWKKTGLPTIVGLEDVIAKLYSAEQKSFSEPTSYKMQDDQPFHRLIPDALFTEREIGLEIRLDQIESAVAELQELRPRLDFILAGLPEIHPELEATIRKTHILSPSLGEPVRRSPDPPAALVRKKESSNGAAKSRSPGG